MTNDENQGQPKAEPRGSGVVRQCFRGLMHLVGGLVAGIAIVAGLLSWQLSKGPISLSFLTPYIEQALNERSADMMSRREVIEEAKDSLPEIPGAILKIGWGSSGSPPRNRLSVILHGEDTKTLEVLGNEVQRVALN